MRFLVRLTAGHAPAEATVLSVRALASSLGSEARNPKLTSYGALEIDVFSPSRADFDLLLAALSPLYRIEFFRDLNLAPVHQSDAQAVEEARGFFNAERYWECHETLESLWRVKEGEEKRYLQGLILLCAAFVHHQKREEGVALGVLGRAIPRLDYPRTSYHGLDVGSIKARAEAMAGSGVFAVFRI